jgi:hypothetical protein
VTLGYQIASGIVVILLALVIAASHFGWGLRRDPQVLAKSSLRGGSLHQRYHGGGGYGYGK